MKCCKDCVHHIEPIKCVKKKILACDDHGQLCKEFEGVSRGVDE